MIVVGGTYHELCRVPGTRALMGSGLRAAAAIASVGPEVRLFSAIEAAAAADAAAMARALSVQATWIDRDERVAFDYYTPLSSPSIDGRLAACAAPIEATGTAALVFGMLESVEVRVSAARVVVDPQQPRDLRALDLTGLKCDELLLVLNAQEARQLSGEAQLPAAAAALRDAHGAAAVVVKAGAVGALVHTDQGSTVVEATPTESVTPIGTGDVFAGALAWFWAHEGLDPVEAARMASAAVGLWAGGGALPIPAADLADAVPAPLRDEFAAPQVYLAAPFFCLADTWLVDLVRHSIRSLGASCFSPLHDVGRGGAEVTEPNLDGLGRSHAVLALLDGDDGGTLLEVGWATHAGIPVCAYASSPGHEYAKLLQGTNAAQHTDLSSAVYTAIWKAIATADVAQR